MWWKEQWFYRYYGPNVYNTVSFNSRKQDLSCLISPGHKKLCQNLIEESVGCGIPCDVPPSQVIVAHMSLPKEKPLNLGGQAQELQGDLPEPKVTKFCYFCVPNKPNPRTTQTADKAPLSPC